MQLTILGSGSIAVNRNCSAYLIKVKNNHLLLDCGAGAYKQLITSGIDLEKIGSIFITHTHVDHVNDFQALLWRYMYGSKRKKQLNIYGPKGFKRFFSNLVKLYPQFSNTKFRLRINELDNISTKIGAVKVIAKRVRHTKYSNAYRVEYNKKSIVYSGDTDYCDEIIELSKNADILILECSMPDDKKAKGHLTPMLCSKIASMANVKKLVLTHFYPECEKLNLRLIIQKEFKGDIVIAKDLAEIYNGGRK